MAQENYEIGSMLEIKAIGKRNGWYGSLKKQWQQLICTFTEYYRITHKLASTCRPYIALWAIISYARFEWIENLS